MIGVPARSRNRWETEPGRGRWRRALVVFCGGSGVWWLRFLKRGYRHCFLVLDDGEHRLVLDPLSHVTEVALHPAASTPDPAAFYREQGHAVVETFLRAPPLRALPWRPFTCVEAVKRVLGIHAGGVLTPWQLFRFLSRNAPCLEKNPMIGKIILTSGNI